MSTMYKIVEDRLAIGSTQKCGSRTVIAYAYLLKHPEELVKNPEKFSSIPGPGKYDYTVDFSMKRTISHLNAFEFNYEKRIVIVRDPITRFISAYSNRSSFYTGDQPISIDEFIQSYDEFSDMPIHFSKLDHSDKFNVYSDIKFHIVPLVVAYGINKNLYTDIFNLRDMDKVKSIIEEISNKKLPDLNLNGTHLEKKPELTNDQKNWILEKFKQDIEVYGQWM